MTAVLNSEGPTVAVIPATRRSVQSGGQLKQQENIRVAAYCRVSTGDESQQSSYTNQKAFYTALIKNKPGWHFAGIYADEAISGTTRTHRIEFNRMMDDAMSGRFDYIITKSISRFARNTVDTLNCVRQLRSQIPPVGIYFEKENIDTLDAAGELILTILSALAQDESRSISDNICWSIRKKFQAGQPHVNLERMLGYHKGPDNEWLIDQDQAEIVRFIFRKFLDGVSANKIATELNGLGKTTVNGKKFTSGGVLGILRNEKYVGDLEMQKTVTVNFLTHQSVINQGEAPRYYVKDHHAGIIDRITWDKTQAVLQSWNNKASSGERKKRGARSSPFVNLRCGAAIGAGICGKSFFRMTYSGTASGYADERSLKDRDARSAGYKGKYIYAYPVWRCSGKREKTQAVCPSKPLQECALEQSFMEMLYRLKRDYQKSGEQSRLALLFKAAYDKLCRRNRNNQCSILRIELLDMQIRELEEALRQPARSEWPLTGEYPPPHPTAASPDAVNEMKCQLDTYRQEKLLLESEQDVTLIMKKNFHFFLDCLLGLPEENMAGMPLNINTLDADNSAPLHTDAGASKGPLSCHSQPPDQLKVAPDYLPFSSSMYQTFIQSGTVYGARIEYLTTFGVTLTSYGNDRTLSSFLGFRTCCEDGSVRLFTSPWQVNNKKIQYQKRKHTSDTSE